VFPWRERRGGPEGEGSMSGEKGSAVMKLSRRQRARRAVKG